MRRRRSGEADPRADPDRALSASFILSIIGGAASVAGVAPPTPAPPTTIRRRRRSRFAGSAICTVISRRYRLRRRNECGKFRRRRRPLIGEMLMRRNPSSHRSCRRCRSAAWHRVNAGVPGNSHCGKARHANRRLVAPRFVPDQGSSLNRGVPQPGQCVVEHGDRQRAAGHVERGHVASRSDGGQP